MRSWDQRKRTLIPEDIYVEPRDIYTDQNGVESLGYPAYFSNGLSMLGQEKALKQRRDYIGEVDYVSWCLSAIVPCHGRGMAPFMASGEDDPEFFVVWFDYLQKQLKVDYMRVFGFTLGPGLDTAKARPNEVMDRLVQDLETVRKERWFDREEDAQSIQSGVLGIQDALKRGKNREVKERIEQLLSALSSMKGRAKGLCKFISVSCPSPQG